MTMTRRSLLPLLLGTLCLPACVIELDGDLHGDIRGDLHGDIHGHCQGDATRLERYTIDEPLTGVVVENGVGNITVHAHASAGADIEATLFGDHPSPRLEVIDGVLHVDVDCDDDSCCGADLDLAIPTAATLEVELGVGDVTVTGVKGAVDVDLGTGDIEVAGLAAAMALHTGTGRVDGRDLACADGWVDVGTGDVSLSYDRSSRIDALAVDVGVGAVDLRIPQGTYDLRLSTGVGDASVSGLASQAGADPRVEVDVGTGDIDIEAL